MKPEFVQPAGSLSVPLLVLLIILIDLPHSHCDDSSEKLITPEYVEQLRQNVSWQVADADKNVFAGKTRGDFRNMLLTQIPTHVRELQAATENASYDNTTTNVPTEDRIAKGDDGPLPEAFDGRTVWGKCIHSGRDQGSCGGCWAFGMTNHLSDRFCIWGRDVVLSVQDLLECDGKSKCCTGGIDYNGYKFMIERGIVSERCRPFDAQCGVCRKPKTDTCRRYRCKQNSMWFSSNIEAAKREIYKNGPVEAVFNVYTDLPNYKSGIYYQTSRELQGVHTVELLGWGREGGVNYWLAKNCWGDDWGMNSFFKIRMGECGINDNMSTCRPLV